jgi:hypothetical protein
MYLKSTHDGINNSMKRISPFPKRKSCKRRLIDIHDIKNDVYRSTLKIKERTQRPNPIGRTTILFFGERSSFQVSEWNYGFVDRIPRDHFTVENNPVFSGN